MEVASAASTRRALPSSRHHDREAAVRKPRAGVRTCRMVGRWRSSRGVGSRRRRHHRRSRHRRMLERVESEEAATVVAWSPDGTRLATGTTRGAVIYRAESVPESASTIDGVPDGATTVAWSPDSDRLAIGTSGGMTVVVDPTTASVLSRCRRQCDAVRAVRWSADSSNVITSSGSQERRFEGRSGKYLNGSHRKRAIDHRAASTRPCSTVVFLTPGHPSSLDIERIVGGLISLPMATRSATSQVDASSPCFLSMMRSATSAFLGSEFRGRGAGPRRIDSSPRCTTSFQVLRVERSGRWKMAPSFRGSDYRKAVRRARLPWPSIRTPGG